MLSDIHLGSDIVGEGSLRPPMRCRTVDKDLLALLAHYRDARAADGPWHLVINGDFIDFTGMSMAVHGTPVSTAPTAEEVAHGLGTAEDHACAKLRRVAERHREVFEALGAFVAAGHQLTIVAGNHDREFHWQGVRRDLRSLLLDASGVRGAHGTATAHAFLQRVRFSPWFFWQEGVAYIEHGHQYDTFCATEHVMVPLSPVDPRRLAPGFNEVLLRFVVQQTRGLRPHGHEQMGVIDYATMAFRLGIGGALTLGGRFVAAILELFRLRRHSLGEAARAVQAEHERRVALLGQAASISLQRLRALLGLQAPPITRSIRGILASLLLDRIALGVLAALVGCALLVAGLLGARIVWALPLAAAGWWLGHRHLSQTRHVDPRDELAARAAPLARLFPAAFVVMGHSHVPVCATLDDQTTTYVNTGSWVEDEGTHPDAPIAYRAARTHLVIRLDGEAPRGELLTWDSEAGPRSFTSG